MKQDIILSTNGLGKYFTDPVKFKVLDDVSFEVKKGEFLTWKVNVIVLFKHDGHQL